MSSLTGNYFGLKKVKILIDKLRKDYIQVRPHVNKNYHLRRMKINNRLGMKNEPVSYLVVCYARAVEVENGH